MQMPKELRAFSLGEVVGAGLAAEAASEDGATLRYRQELQRLGHGAIIEVSWADGPSFGLVRGRPRRRWRA